MKCCRSTMRSEQLREMKMNEREVPAFLSANTIMPPQAATILKQPSHPGRLVFMDDI